jgi:hypothetical protein
VSSSTFVVVLQRRRRRQQWAIVFLYRCYHLYNTRHATRATHAIAFYRAKHHIEDNDMV